MELGLVGLGKMGGNMRERIRRAGHTVIGYDRNPDLADVQSLEELVGRLKGPRVVWVMVPAGAATQATIDELSELLEPGDIVVDGGNSRWTDDEKHAVQLGIKDIGFVDCGVSGGVWGLENGYALMYGGTEENVAKVQPVFDALKPEGEFGSVHAGKVGAGHFAKMVHNGIEYAMMQAFAEGWELLENRSPTSGRSSAPGRRGPSSAPGCSTSRSTRSTRTSTWSSCAAGPPTPARAGGRSRPPSTTPCRSPPSPPRSSPASRPARTTRRR